MPILEIADLNVKYGQHLAVANVSLQVDHEIVCVLGANGAGKTSMLNAISGAVAPASGKISFNGADIAGRPAYAIARLGLVQVPQGRRIFAPLTVEDNLLIGAYTLRSKARQRELLEQAYALFPILKERRALAGGLLSGGQQQMLAFGRALMADPKMLLLDEPSLGLAPIMIQTVMAAVATMAANGLPILMVEQNANMALRIAARAYVLEEGEIIVDGPATQIRNNPMVLRAFLGLEERTPAG